MKKISAVLLSVLLIIGTGLNAMAAPLITSVDAIDGNWVVKGSWSGETPLTIEVLKQVESDAKPLTWQDIDSAGDIDGNVLNYLAYFNQCDNENGSFEFKISSAANLPNSPEIRIYADGKFIYYSIKVLNDINSSSDGAAIAKIIASNSVGEEIEKIFESYEISNDGMKSMFWEKLYSYKSKTNGFSDFPEIVSASTEIAIITKVAQSDGNMPKNLELLKKYGIDKSDSYDLYMNQGNFSRQTYMTDGQKKALCTDLANRAKEQELTNAADFIQYFNDKVVLIACHNNASDYLVRDIIDQSAVLAKEGIGKYSALSAEQRLKIASMINASQTKFGTVSQLALKISDEADKLAGEEAGVQSPGKDTSHKGNNSFSVITTPAVPAEPNEPTHKFTDLSNHKWAETAIYALQQKGIIQGTSAQSFEPERGVTREEFVKMLVLAAGVMDNSSAVPFADAEPNAWYVPYIASAYNAKLVAGVTDTTFGIGKTITREQLAVMVHRAIAAKGNLQQVNATGAFTDFDLVSDFAKDAVVYVNAAGIMNGMGDGSFAPLQSVTRAQAAKVIYELITRL